MAEFRIPHKLVALGGISPINLEALASFFVQGAQGSILGDPDGALGGTFYVAGSADVASRGNLTSKNFKERAGIRNDQKEAQYATHMLQLQASIVPSASSKILYSQLPNLAAPNMEWTVVQFCASFRAETGAGAVQGSFQLWKNGPAASPGVQIGSTMDYGGAPATNVYGTTDVVSVGTRLLAYVNLSAAANNTLKAGDFVALQATMTTGQMLGLSASVWLKGKHIP